MKSEHRHQLGTNVLAKQLDSTIERVRPYASTIAGVVVAVVVLMFAWSYFAGSSAARQSEAWDAYNLAIAEAVPDVEQLRQAAQEHPGTAMQQMADVTWADSQVWHASNDYLYNRSAAMEALAKATSAYQGVLQTTADVRLKNRAQLGLARVYELQGKLDEAREAYLKVAGGYDQYAKLQAERLAKPEAKEAYNWLASARATFPRAMPGPGTPGQRPPFSADELALPDAEAPAGSATPGESPSRSESIDDLLKGLELDFGSKSQTGDRYAPAAPPSPADEVTPASPKPEEGTTSGTPPAPPEDKSPPAEDAHPPTGDAGASAEGTNGTPAAGPSGSEADKNSGP